VKLGLKGEQTVMNAAQIKDEIRKLNRIDKIEIYRWIDREVAEDLFYRIGMYRSLEIRQQFEQMCKTTSPERRVNLGNKEKDSFNLGFDPLLQKEE
jgi:hypothetical protein